MLNVFVCSSVLVKQYGWRSLQFMPRKDPRESRVLGFYTLALDECLCILNIYRGMWNSKVSYEVQLSASLKNLISNSKVKTKYMNQIMHLHYEKLNLLATLKVFPLCSSKHSLHCKVTLLVVGNELPFL